MSTRGFLQSSGSEYERALQDNYLWLTSSTLNQHQRACAYSHAVIGFVFDASNQSDIRHLKEIENSMYLFMPLKLLDGIYALLTTTGRITFSYTQVSKIQVYAISYQYISTLLLSCGDEAR